MVSSILLIWRNLPFFFKYFCVGELPEFNQGAMQSFYWMDSAVSQQPLVTQTVLTEL